MLSAYWVSRSGLVHRYADNSKDELLYEYTDLGHLKGKTEVYMEPHSGLVIAIGFYPTALLSRNKVIEKYGNKYLERDARRPCATEKELQELEADNTHQNHKNPTALIYPGKGMVVFLNEKGAAWQIFYELHCP